MQRNEKKRDFYVSNINNLFLYLMLSFLFKIRHIGRLIAFFIKTDYHILFKKIIP